MKILWYVQNVIGIGHVIRSLKICREFIDAQITFLIGGQHFDLPKYPNINIVYLPGIMMNETFTDIFPCDTTKTMDVTWNNRRSVLRNLLCSSSYDLIVTEIFPFGRSSVRWEVLDLLKYNRLKPKPAKVVCSLRDVLFLEHADKDYPKYMKSYANDLYDLILVHADKQFDQFKEQVSFAHELVVPVVYTGYVVNKMIDHSKTDIPSVCVNIGSGSVCVDLIFKSILASISLYPEFQHELHVYLGPYLSTEYRQQIVELSKNFNHIRINEFDPDFCSILKQFHLSISLAGYNTTLELLAAGIPGIVYPFYSNHEQVERLSKLNTHNQLTVIAENELTVENLTKLMRERLSSNQEYTSRIDLSGIETTIHQLRNLIGGSR